MLTSSELIAMIRLRQDSATIFQIIEGMTIEELSQRTDDGETILHIIAIAVEQFVMDQEGAFALKALMITLVKKGVDFTVRNKDGKTACDIIESKEEEIVKTFRIRNYFDPGAVLIKLMNARNVCMTTVVNVIETMDDMALSEMRLKYTGQEEWQGFFFNILNLNANLWRPKDLQRIVKAALKQGVSIDAVDKCGYTALHLALFLKHTWYLECFLENGANPDCLVESEVENQGDTALHLAVRYFISGERPWLDAIAILLEAGADPTITNQQGQCACDLDAERKLEAAFPSLFGSPNSPVAIRVSTQDMMFALACGSVDVAIAIPPVVVGGGVIATSASSLVLHDNSRFKRWTPAGSQAVDAAQNKVLSVVL